MECLKKLSFQIILFLSSLHKKQKRAALKKMLPTGEKICWKKEEHERKTAGRLQLPFLFCPTAYVSVKYCSCIAKCPLLIKLLAFRECAGFFFFFFGRGHFSFYFPLFILRWYGV